MKKIKLSLAGLLLSGLSYGQCVSTISKECCKKTIQAVYEHEGMVMSNVCKDSISISRYELIEMIATIEDILEWQRQDVEYSESIGEGNWFCGSFEEGWGSNYWLTLMLNDLRTKLNITN